MHDFYIFVAAIIFVIVALPVLQTVSDIIVTFGRWILSIFNLHIAKNNSIIQNYQEPVNTQAIGFQASLNDSDCEYDDGNKSNEKIKIGFRG